MRKPEIRLTRRTMERLWKQKKKIGLIKEIKDVEELAKNWKIYKKDRKHQETTKQ